MSAAEQALKEAKLLMPFALGPKSTRDQRLVFYKQLIKLASYPSYGNRSFFGTLLAKFFAEFEDLQDEAVDALLDLCEDDDEKTRIVGIQGLGATGKADPRWVKGNTGVLLQLLGSQSTELKHVKDSLSTLIKTSPDDVYDVMRENLNSPESETGVSRENIVRFLQENFPQAVDHVLRSGSERGSNGKEADEREKHISGSDHSEPGLVVKLSSDKDETSGPIITEKVSAPVMEETPRKTAIQTSSIPHGPRAERIPTGPKADPRPQPSRNNGIPSGPKSSLESRYQPPSQTQLRTRPPTPPKRETRIQTASSSTPSAINHRSQIASTSNVEDTTPVLQERSTPTAAPSLASRLGAPVKRQREELLPESIPPSSNPTSALNLLSRLGPSSNGQAEIRPPKSMNLASRLSSSSDESRDNKRSREEAKPRSLIDRMQPSSSSSSPQIINPLLTPQRSVGLSILNRSTSGSAEIGSTSGTPQRPASLSILNRSISSSSQTLINHPTASSQSSTPTSTFTIKNHSTTAAPPLLTAPEDDGIIRKGRGFRKDADDDVIMTLPVSVPVDTGRGEGGGRGKLLNRYGRGGEAGRGNFGRHGNR